jgi:hypothetical protein
VKGGIVLEVAGDYIATPTVLQLVCQKRMANSRNTPYIVKFPYCFAFYHPTPSSTGYASWCGVVKSLTPPPMIAPIETTIRNFFVLLCLSSRKSYATFCATTSHILDASCSHSEISFPHSFCACLDDSDLIYNLISIIQISQLWQKNQTSQSQRLMFLRSPVM